MFKHFKQGYITYGYNVWEHFQYHFWLCSENVFKPLGEKKNILITFLKCFEDITKRIPSGNELSNIPETFTVPKNKYSDNIKQRSCNIL